MDVLALLHEVLMTVKQAQQQQQQQASQPLHRQQQEQEQEGADRSAGWRPLLHEVGPSLSAVLPVCCPPSLLSSLSAFLLLVLFNWRLCCAVLCNGCAVLCLLPGSGGSSVPSQSPALEPGQA